MTAQQPQGRAFGKTNVVPNRVIVRGGMRTISQQQLDNAREAMRAVVAQNLAFDPGKHHVQRQLSPYGPDRWKSKPAGICFPPSTWTWVGRPMPILDASRRGAADISFVAPYTDGLAGMGAYGQGGHTPNESLDLDSIPIAIQRAAILIYRLSQ